MENIQLRKPDFTNFVAYCLRRGGHVANTGFKNWEPMWPSYCNPSIFYDEKDNKFRMIQRNVSYILNGSKGMLWDGYGPLRYSIPQERFDWLETRNWIGETKDPMASDWGFKEIEMKPRKQMWSFRGLEDARCVRWNGKLYAIGVRRDDNSTGVGRMEMCELDENYNEVRSVKLKAPDGDKAYCIKNWMPVTDMPYWFIDRAANPVRLVRVSPETGDINYTINRPTEKLFEGFDMPRGSSQCIPWGYDHHLTIIHLCTMYYLGNGRKFARYYHAFIEYNKEWDVERVSPLFSFDDLYVEFCTGMTQKDNIIYISFALQDNCSYVLETSATTIDKFMDKAGDVDNTPTNTIWDKKPSRSLITKYVNNLFSKGDYAGAYTWFSKIVDLYDYTYDERFMCARSIANLGHRDSAELGLWMDVIEHDPSRPEGYCAVANYHFCRYQNAEAWYWIKKAMEKMVSKLPTIWYNVEDIRHAYKQISKQTRHYDEVDKTLQAVKAF